MRQVAAWKNAWASCLINTVQHHGGGMYTVPSTSEEDKWYAVWRYPLAPDGYLYICQCKASETAGVVCQHAMAVYLFRLRHVFHWRLKRPEGGADARGKTAPATGKPPRGKVAEREARSEAGAEAV
jgi:hypothetical protein